MNINRSDIKIRSARLFFRNKIIDTNLSIEEKSCLLTKSPDFSWLQSSKVLRVLSLNCRSLLSMYRRVMLDILLKTICPDIVCLTETWLNPIIENQEVLISQSYSIQSRSDRKLGPRGGVLIAHRNTLSGKTEVLRTNSDFICCCLYIFKEVTIVIITIYNPPADRKYRLSEDLFCKAIQEIVRDVQEYQRSIEAFTFFLNADIKFTHTDWLTLSSNCSYENAVLKDFKNLNMSSLQSHSSSPDIFLSNNANLCSEILEEKSSSNHMYFLAEISIERWARRFA